MHKKALNLIREQIKNLENPDQPVLVAADEAGGAILDVVAKAVLRAKFALMEAESELVRNYGEDEPVLTASDFDDLAKMAEEYDKSGQPELIRRASVLDQILLTIGTPKGSLEAFKQAEDKEIQKLRAKYREEDGNRYYKGPKTEHDKDMKVADSIKAIDNSIKEYRPLEAPLSTRTCPDHPGAQLARIGEDVYQCSLDKKIYNYKGGFTTLKGNKIPGGDVSGQTQALGDRTIEHQSFDTRESKLNP